MYKCYRCNEIVEPVYEEWDEPMPFGYYEHWRRRCCPYCGEDVDEIDFDYEEETLEWLEEQMAS